MSRILIGALSCKATPERRERCLNTWAAGLSQHASLDLVFLIGGEPGPPRREGQILNLPCEDDYPSLPQKVRHFFLWALEHHDFEYIFKCDDDTYIHLERFLAYDTQGNDYIGAEWQAGVDYASGGAGYFVSRQAALIAATGLESHPTGAEDLLVGKSLREANVKFTIDSRFIPFGNDEKRPKPENEIITAHACDLPWKAHRAEVLGLPPVASCRPMGRLGNRLFQVAAALGYAAKHQTHQPVFDAAQFDQRSRDTFFRNLKYDEIPSECQTIGDPSDFTFHDPLPDWPTSSVLFVGYHQSERYFAHCPELIRAAFELPLEIKEELTTKYESILAGEPVAMHVRRGDYLAKQQYHPVQPASYYLRGLAYLDSRVAVETVLCFSDDPEWCRSELASADSRICVISHQDEYLDLALMSFCHHFVLSNSTFSWWGAWLSRRPGKIVITPDRHFGVEYAHYSEEDLYPGCWLAISDVLDESEPHPRGFRRHRQPRNENEFDPALCAALRDFLISESGTVADFGCGSGRYVEELRSAGIDCDGFDGNPFTPELTEGRCSVLDLSSVVKLPRRYDWILSLDVLPCLPVDTWEVFLRNLDQHCHRGIIQSQSWPVSEHASDPSRAEFLETWHRLMESAGYRRDLIAQRQLCQNLRPHSHHRSSLQIFRKSVRTSSKPISPGEVRLLVGKNNPLILELGCNDGSDTERFLEEFESATIHCFEPDPRPLQRFKVSDDRCRLHQVAIAESDGQIELQMSGGSPPGWQVSDWDLSSSIHLPTHHLVVHPWCTFEKSCLVAARSLDSWAAEQELTLIDFIWADLQGAEGDLIRGGSTTLREKTRFLYTEFYDTPMYQGQWTRQQILEELPEFECVGIFEGYNMLLWNKRFER